MSAPNQVGSFAVVASLAGGLAIAISGTTRTVEVNGLSYDRTSEELMTKNSDGETVHMMFWDFAKTLRLQCFPRSDTKANAATINNLDITPGTIFWIGTSSGNSQADTAVAENGTAPSTSGKLYVCRKFSKAHEAGGKVTWDVELHAPDAMTIAAIT
jgi:hypothetical protein